MTVAIRINIACLTSGLIAALARAVFPGLVDDVAFAKVSGYLLGISLGAMLVGAGKLVLEVERLRKKVNAKVGWAVPRKLVWKLVLSEAEMPAVLSFPKVWKLLGFLFTRKVRQKVWDPLVGEDVIDYLDAMERVKSMPARALVRVFFSVRTCLRIFQVLWAVGLDKVVFFGLAAWKFMTVSK